MSSNTTSATESLRGASLSQFLTTLSVSAIIAAIQIVVFLIIRLIFKRIYQPKTFVIDESRRTKVLPKSPLRWLIELLKIPREDLIRVAGLDAYFFARYIYIHAVYFLCSFVLLSAILFPVYAIDGLGESFGKRGLDILTFGNISPKNSLRYVAPLLLAFVFIGIFFYISYSEMKLFVEKRQSILRSSAYQSRVSATTVLVTAIPKEYMKTEILFRIFDQCPGGVKHIWLNYDLGNLPDKAEQRNKFVDKVEGLLCKWIRSSLKHFKEETEISLSTLKRPTIRFGSIPVLSSLCFGKKYDGIEFYQKKISDLNEEIDKEKSDLSKFKLLNSAFIRFNKPLGAHIAMNCVSSSKPLTMTPKYIDIKTENIIWSNLRLTYYELKIRKIIVFTATTALIIFWAFPVAFVGLISNVTYLTEKLTFLRFIYDLPTFLLGLITGLLPSILLAILMALLPIVLRFLAKLSGLPTVDAVDRYVQSSYFAFQVIHGFLVVNISSSITSVIVAIIQNPPSIANILAANIPTASNFFFSFIALQGLGDSATILLQLVTLILFYSLGKLLDNTPRKKWRRFSTLTDLSWGTIYPMFTNLVVITLVYSIIAPFVLIVSGLSFLLYYVAYIYTMFYVSDSLIDSVGLTFPKAIHQSFTGIYLMEVLLAGLFFLATDENGRLVAIPHAVLMCILVAITVIFQLLIRSSFNPLIYTLPLDAEYLMTSGDYQINRSLSLTKEDAYLNPSIRDPRPIIWVPEDRFGIALREAKLLRDSDLNLSISTIGAKFNEKFKIEITSEPPDYVDRSDYEIMQARF